MSTDPSLAIVFVSYNCGADIADLIRGLKASPLAGYQVRYVAVDNASSDDSVAQLSALEADDVIVVPSTENLGFGRGCNLAFELCQDSDQVLLMNPDVTLFEDSVAQLLAAAKGLPDAGIWGGVTLNEQHQPDGAHAWREPTLIQTLAWATYVDQIVMLLTGTSLAAYPTAMVAHSDHYSVDAVSGCFLLIDRGLLDRLGGFDPQFFMYSEEIDLCRRARELGAQPTVCTQAKLIHAGSATVTSLNKLRFLHGSKLKYFSKHWSPLKYAVAYAVAYAGVALRVVGFGLKSMVSDDSKPSYRNWRSVAVDRSVWRLDV